MLFASTVPVFSSADTNVTVQYLSLSGFGVSSGSTGPMTSFSPFAVNILSLVIVSLAGFSTTVSLPSTSSYQDAVWSRWVASGVGTVTPAVVRLESLKMAYVLPYKDLPSVPFSSFTVLSSLFRVTLNASSFGNSGSVSVISCPFLIRWAVYSWLFVNVALSCTATFLFFVSSQYHNL